MGLLSESVKNKCGNTACLHDRVELAAELIAEGRDGVAVLPIGDGDALEADVTTG